MDEEARSLDAFREAAIAWAAGGRGQPLVDAAAEALAAGLDSPTLRVLAGTPRFSADEEVLELAPVTFAELGLDIETRLSSAAFIEGGRQLARSFLAGDVDARRLTKLLTGLYVEAGYPAELNTWMGLDDYYDMIRDGVVTGSVDAIDAEVADAANDLASGRPRVPVSIGSLFVGPTPISSSERRRRRWLRRRKP
ncbi:MAG: hypothetical protein R2715_07210 [Ilumatobacteraceae bacterium]